MKNRHLREAGLLPWAFAALLLLGAVSVFLSGRDLTLQFLVLMQTSASDRSPVMIWLQRGVSVLLMIAAIEQVAHHLNARRPVPSVTLLTGFMLYWIGTIGIPAIFGAEPVISHEYTYSLALGVAACLLYPGEHVRVVHTARDTLFLMMLAGIALIPLKTNMVLDTSYSQGVIRGLPRFGGLTMHPVTQGMLAQVALLLLWCHPYRRKWLTRAAWILGLGVLLLAQSKTTWVAFAACALVLAAVRHGGSFWQRATDPRGGGFGVVVCLLVMVGVLGLGAWMLLGDVFGMARDFADSNEAAQLMTLTGRDRIWAAALEEWSQNPTFGYGHTIWDAAYRAAIGMPQATHAHNQFLDDLARAGSVGAATLVIYAAILLVLSVRSARASGGLTLALFVFIALRSVSEVPLSLFGYGTELFTHLLLVASIASASAQRQPQTRTAPLRYGVAS